MNPLVSIIIPTKDRKHILDETLAALYGIVPLISAEIIVVNDSKTEDLHIDHPQVTVLNNPKQGAASARNYGFAHSSAALVLFLDDDMLLTALVLEEMIALTQENDRCIYLPNWEYPGSILHTLDSTLFGRFLTHIRYTSLRGWIGNTATDWGHEPVLPHTGIASYCLLFKREDFRALGGYNEAFPFAGFEDHDLTERLIARGFRFFILTQATIYHNEQDRTTLPGFLDRRRRNATTQRKATTLGYSDLVLTYSPAKRLLFGAITPLRPLLLFLCKHAPNTRFFDFLYRVAVKALIGHAIYSGYSVDYDKQESPNA